MNKFGRARRAYDRRLIALTIFSFVGHGVAIYILYLAWRMQHYGPTPDPSWFEQILRKYS